jgi:squalene-associated FAD-dependent desaturase
MGCYRETLDFLRTIGTRDRLIVHRNLEIEMLRGPGQRAQLRTARLPGPFHMLAGLFGYRHLTPIQRFGVARAGMKMMYMRRFDRGRLSAMTVAQLMDVTGQGSQARQCFWYPLAIATLNEDPELASALLLAEVMKRAFFSRRIDSAFLYSTVGLTDLYCGAACEYIQRRDGVVATHAIAERLDLDGNGMVNAVRLRDGRTLRAANFIAAVPPEQLLRLLPEGATSDSYFADIAHLGSSPIICVHVWLDREVTKSAFVGFIGTSTQWMFNKRRIFAQHGARHPGYLSFVISGARKLVDMPNDELLGLVITDLRAMIPSARQANTLRALVLKEKHATIAPDPASDRRRPRNATPIPNFFTAGDWTQTGLPATIESAVISGRAAATAVIDRVGAIS